MYVKFVWVTHPASWKQMCASWWVVKITVLGKQASMPNAAEADSKWVLKSKVHVTLSWLTLQLLFIQINAWCAWRRKVRCGTASTASSGYAQPIWMNTMPLTFVPSTEDQETSNHPVLWFPPSSGKQVCCVQTDHLYFRSRGPHRNSMRKLQYFSHCWN